MPLQEGLKELLAFQPDVIIAIGGGSPMDAAKVIIELSCDLY